MKRDIFQVLLDWKAGSNRKPILMRGAARWENPGWPRN